MNRRTTTLLVLFAATAVLSWLAAAWADDDVAPDPAHDDAAMAGANAPSEHAGASARRDDSVTSELDRAAVEDPAAARPGPDVPHVRLRVLDADGAPIAGAAVQTFVDTVPGTTTTDADGTCVLAATFRGDHVRIRVDHGARHLHRTFPIAATITVTLHDAGALRGRLVDADTGTPVAGEITWVHDDCVAPCGPERAVADAEGRFELVAVPRGRDLRFELRAAGYPDQPSHVFLPGRGEPIEHTFRIRRGVEVAGRVVDATTRAPIANALVAGEPVDPNGGFRRLLWPEQGRVRLAITAPGYCGMTALRDPPFDALADASCEYGMVAPFPLLGTVRTPGGRPIAGARVTLQSTGWTKPIPGVPERCNLEEPSDTTAISDEQGVFGFGAVPRRRYRLAASHRDYEPMAPAQVDHAADRDAPAPVLVLVAKPPLGPSGSIVGSYRKNGLPAHAAVRWRAANREGAVETDAAGTFAIEQVPAGLVELTAMPVLFRSLSDELQARLGTQQQVAIAAGQQLPVVFEHVLAEVEIHGHVRYTDGAPVRNHPVEAFARMLVCRARTGPDGRYALAVPAALERVEVAAEGCLGTARKAAPGARGVDFVLPRLGTLLVRAVGEPDTHVQLWLRGDQAEFEPCALGAVGDPHGYRRTQPLPQGRYTAFATAAGRGLVVHELELGAESRLDLDLAPQVAVTLRLAPDARPSSPGWTPVATMVPDAVFARGLADALDELSGLDALRAALTFEGVRVPGVAPGRYHVVGRAIDVEPEVVDVPGAGAVIDVRWRDRRAGR